MRILLLTSVNPVENAIYYNQILDFFGERKDIRVISVPFFAETHAKMEGKYYLPTLFSMFKTLHQDKKVNEKVLKGRHLLVIGNIYKSSKFDMVISLGNEEEENKYISEIFNNEEFSDFKKISKAGKLYRWEDAEINLPTIDKVKLFLKGAFKNDKI